MLTGLEQYSLERAGYFIRRAALTPDSPRGVVGLLELLLPTVQSVLGQGPITPYGGSGAEPGRWTRGYSIPWDLPPAEQIAALARTTEHLQVRAAASPDESLALLPGTHAAPPALGDLTQLVRRPTGDTPGMVQVRLAPGDTLFWNTNVIHRDDAGDVIDRVFRVTFVTENCMKPSWATDLLDRIGKDMR
jgi:hypothetical protein